MGDDLRRGQRIIKTGEFEAKVVKVPKKRACKGLRFDGKTRNVSVHGMQVMSPAGVPVGSIMKLKVNGQKEGRVCQFKLRGEVVWVSEMSPEQYLLGLQLQDRPRRHKHGWEDYIHETIRFRGL